MKLSREAMETIKAICIDGADEALRAYDYKGMCCKCGYMQDNVDEDEECLPCEGCGEFEVYGLLRILIFMGYEA